MSNAERQRRWLEKNLALHNFRRRKKNLGGSSSPNEGSISESSDQPETATKRAISPAQSSESKIAELRALIKEISAAPTVPVAKPQVFRDDYGRVIGERQWQALKKRKEAARDGGYSIDDYSQG